MKKFTDNNNISLLTNMTLFYFNKGFHLRMSFDLDCTSYHSTQEHLLMMSVEDIAGKMKELLHYEQSKLIRSQQKMKDQANKHCTEAKFYVGQKMWVSLKNIKTEQASEALKDKMFGPYKIIEKIGEVYWIRLPVIIKWLNIFHLLKMILNPENSLPDQYILPLNPVMVDDHKEWKLDNILASHCWHRKLQYQVQWHGFPHDDTWYDTESDNFTNAQEIVTDFYKYYSDMLWWS